MDVCLPCTTSTSEEVVDATLTADWFFHIPPEIICAILEFLMTSDPQAAYWFALTSRRMLMIATTFATLRLKSIFGITRPFRLPLSAFLHRWRTRCGMCNGFCRSEDHFCLIHNRRRLCSCCAPSYLSAHFIECVRSKEDICRHPYPCSRCWSYPPSLYSMGDWSLATLDGFTVPECGGGALQIVLLRSVEEVVRTNGLPRSAVRAVAKHFVDRKLSIQAVWYLKSMATFWTAPFVE